MWWSVVVVVVTAAAAVVVVVAAAAVAVGLVTAITPFGRTVISVKRGLNLVPLPLR
jgi:hypothetical protein